MEPASTSKKRKRDDNEAKVSFALSDQPKSQLGPVLGE
jgi:DNA-directed RNA polymerase I subunit RPA49